MLKNNKLFASALLCAALLLGSGANSADASPRHGHFPPHHIQHGHHGGHHIGGHSRIHIGRHQPPRPHGFGRPHGVHPFGLHFRR